MTARGSPALDACFQWQSGNSISSVPKTCYCRSHHSCALGALPKSRYTVAVFVQFSAMCPWAAYCSEIEKASARFRAFGNYHGRKEQPRCLRD